MVMVAGASVSPDASAHQSVTERSQVDTIADHSLHSTDASELQEEYAPQSSAMMDLLAHSPEQDAAPQTEQTPDTQVGAIQEGLQQTQRDQQANEQKINTETAEEMGTEAATAPQQAPEPFTKTERQELLERAEQYGRDRAELEMELQAYQRKPPESERGKERARELMKQIQELDKSSAEFMKSLQHRLAGDPELNVQLSLEFTGEMRDLRVQQAVNEMRSELTARLLKDANGTLEWAQDELEDMGWMESWLGGEEPWEAIIKHQQERNIPHLEKQSEAFAQIRDAGNELIERFKESQARAILAQAAGGAEAAGEYQLQAAGAAVAMRQFDEIQRNLNWQGVEISKIGKAESDAAWNGYMGNLQTTIEVCGTIRDTSIIVGTGVATGGLGLLAGAAVGVGIAATTRIGGNTLAALTSDDIDIDDVFDNFTEDMSHDLLLVVSGALGGGAGGAVTKNLMSRSSTLLTRAASAAGGGATAGATTESVLITGELVAALKEFENLNGVDSLSDEQRAEKLSQFLEQKGLSTEHILKRLGTSVASGAAGGALGVAGSRLASSASTVTGRLAAEGGELAADVISGEVIASVIHGEELTLKALAHSMMAAGLGAAAARAGNTPRADVDKRRHGEYTPEQQQAPSRSETEQSIPRKKPESKVSQSESESQSTSDQNQDTLVADTEQTIQRQEPEASPEVNQEQKVEQAKQEAQKLREQAIREEPGVTETVESVASHVGGELRGKEHRIKGQERAEQKAERLMKSPDSKPEEIPQNLNDSLRYTIEIKPEKYADGIKQSLEKFQEQGFEVADIKNFWKENGGTPYRGVNVTLRTPDGLLVEVQFHTPDSYQVRESNHQLYEERRKPETSSSQKKKLHKQMKQAVAELEEPPNIQDLENMRE